MPSNQVSAWVCADAPKAYLYVGFREPTDPYPRVWIRTFSREAMTDLTGDPVAVNNKQIEGPDYMDYEIGLCKSEEAMDVLVAFIDTFSAQINRIGDTQLMKPTGENDKSKNEP